MMHNVFTENATRSAKTVGTLRAACMQAMHCDGTMCYIFGGDPNPDPYPYTPLYSLVISMTLRPIQRNSNNDMFSPTITMHYFLEKNFANLHFTDTIYQTSVPFLSPLSPHTKILYTLYNATHNWGMQP